MPTGQFSQQVSRVMYVIPGSESEIRVAFCVWEASIKKQKAVRVLMTEQSTLKSTLRSDCHLNFLQLVNKKLKAREINVAATAPIGRDNSFILSFVIESIGTG